MGSKTEMRRYIGRNGSELESVGRDCVWLVVAGE